MVPKNFTYKLTDLLTSLVCQWFSFLKENDCGDRHVRDDKWLPGRFENLILRRMKDHTLDDVCEDLYNNYTQLILEKLLFERKDGLITINPLSYAIFELVNISEHQKKCGADKLYCGVERCLSVRLSDFFLQEDSLVQMKYLTGSLAQETQNVDRYMKMVSSDKSWQKWFKQEYLQTVCNLCRVK